MFSDFPNSFRSIITPKSTAITSRKQSQSSEQEETRLRGISEVSDGEYLVMNPSSTTLSDGSPSSKKPPDSNHPSVCVRASELFAPSPMTLSWEEEDGQERGAERGEEPPSIQSEDMFQCEVKELSIEVVDRDKAFEIYEYFREPNDSPKTSQSKSHHPIRMVMQDDDEEDWDDFYPEYIKPSKNKANSNNDHTKKEEGGGGGYLNNFPRLAGLNLASNSTSEAVVAGRETRDLMMNKLRSAWNNVKFGWSVKLKPNFSQSAPIYLLGRCYFQKASGKRLFRSVPEIQLPDPSGRYYLPSLESFFRDYSSRLWFTYRVNFPPLPLPANCPRPRSSVVPVVQTSDCGWGCMLRSGQMMLAQAMMMHFINRSWSYQGQQTLKSEAFHRQIIRWFGDSSDPSSPFSLHHLLRLSGKTPGEWFGPATVCQLFKQALGEAVRLQPQLDNLTIYLAEDRVIYKEDIMALGSGVDPSKSPISGNHEEDSGFSSNITNSETSLPPWKAILVLIPMYLGGAEGFNPIYQPVLQRLFTEDWCVGMIGGRPKHSVYYVGFQEDRLIYMDPHFCQEAINVQRDGFKLHTYHCFFPKKMSFSRLDPSCAFGFYLRTRKDLELFLANIAIFTRPPQSSPDSLTSTRYPLVEVLPGTRPTPPSDDSQMTLRVHQFNERSGKCTVNEYELL